MSKHEIWASGWTGMLGMGEWGPAHLLGVVEAESFDIACEILSTTYVCSPESKIRAYINADGDKRWESWGCKLVSSEKEGNAFITDEVRKWCIVPKEI